MGDADSFRDPNLQKSGAGNPVSDAPTIYSFRQPARDWIAWLFDELIPVPPDAVLIDVGCGPGPYVPAARRRVPNGVVVPVDISLDRLRQIDDHHNSLQSDVAALALRTGSATVALAMHMLYHLPDIARGVAEIRRVLRPGGALYALTNGAHDMPELVQLYVHCGLARPEGLGGLAFTAENGASMLRTAFADVHTVELRNSSLVVTDPRAIVGEAARLRYSMESHLDAEIDWDEFLERVESEASRAIATNGAFEITEHHALFVAT
jgi:SAM-dependent methyltransferase